MNWKLWQSLKRQDGVQGRERYGGRRLWLAGIGVIMVIAGGYLLFGVNLDYRSNAFLGLMPIAIMVAGGYLVKQGISERERTTRQKQTAKGRKEEKEANCIEICVRKNGMGNLPYELRFVNDQSPEPVGKLIEVTNWRREYYVRSVYYAPAAGRALKKEPLELPDGEVLSPRLYLIPLLMRAYEQVILSLRTNSHLDTIKMGVMLAAFGITSFILFLTISG